MTTKPTKPTRPTGPAAPCDHDHDEEEFFEECLRRHGQLADEGCTELPPGATHQITRDAKGERKVTRKRYSAF